MALPVVTRRRDEHESSEAAVGRQQTSVSAELRLRVRCTSAVCRPALAVGSTTGGLTAAEFEALFAVQPAWNPLQ
jgi:hypothetical protein